MKLEDYEALPDKLSVAEVHEYTMQILSSPMALESALAKLEILADRQWHTYELPAPELQAALREWLIRHWVSKDEWFLETVLGLAYCYALDKEFYQKALEAYSGEHLAEFQEIFNNSKGDSIDPWWSLGPRNA
jgi:hypothetical protein